MSEVFYSKLLNYLQVFKEWHDWQVNKQKDKGRPTLPGSILPLLNECIFNKYSFTDEQAKILIGFSEAMLYSHKPFIDFVTLLAYCGVKGYPGMETSIDVDTNMLRKTESHPCEIAARCLQEVGVFKKGELPLYYDYGVIAFHVATSFRGALLILTNYRAFAIGGIFFKDKEFYKPIYEYPESYLRSLDYVYLDKRLNNVENVTSGIRAVTYTKFFMVNAEKHSILIPFIGTLKTSEKGHRQDWLSIFFILLDLGADIKGLKKNFDLIKKKFPKSDVVTEFPYSKKSISKDDQYRRVAVLYKKLEEIRQPIKDTTVAWHVDA